MSRLENRIQKLENREVQNHSATQRFDEELERRRQESPEGYARVEDAQNNLQRALKEAGFEEGADIPDLEVLIHHPKADAALEHYLNVCEDFVN